VGRQQGESQVGSDGEVNTSRQGESQVGSDGEVNSSHTDQVVVTPKYWLWWVGHMLWAQEQKMLTEFW
jgi:hypothetical protein